MTALTPTNGTGYSVLSAKPFHSRKGHSKSRKGCDACKRRKKKCDEVLPGCTSCEKSGITCNYSNVRTVSRPSQQKLASPPGINIAMNSLPGLEPDERELLHHFNCQTLATVGSSIVQEVVAGCLPAALEIGFMKHAICSFAASHKVSLSEYQDGTSSYHLGKSLLAFRQRLSAPITATQVDAVLTSCVLLNMIAFFNGDHTPQNSWLFADEADFQWLTMQAGIRSIVPNIRHLLGESSWATVYATDAHQFHGIFRASFDDDIFGFENVPDNLKRFFSIEPNTCSAENAYYTTLHALLPLLTLDAGSKSLTQLMTVVHRLTPGFYQLLRTKDVRALLLLAYWLGLMCEVHLWWVLNRARSECFACCRYLDMNSNDTVRDLLLFPAKRCGYKIGMMDKSDNFGNPSVTGYATRSNCQNI